MKKVYITCLALVLVIAMILPVGVVSADSPQIEISGDIELEFDYSAFVPEKIVGKPPVMICTMAFFVYYYNGNLEGEAYETFSSRLNFNSGAFSSVGIQDFEGSLWIDGTEYIGSFKAHVRHQGGEDQVTKVEQTIISGTGDLANLRGTMNFTVSPGGLGFTGTYTDKLYFAR